MAQKGASMSEPATNDLSVTADPARSAYFVRICDVFGTAWQVPREYEAPNLEAFALTNTFKDFYLNQKGLPQLIAQEYYSNGQALSVDGSGQDFEDLFRVEVVLFALPIPVNQVVAAVVVDMMEAEVSGMNGSRIRRLRDAMVAEKVRLRLNGKSVAEIVDRLASGAGAEPVDPLNGVPDDTTRLENGGGAPPDPTTGGSGSAPSDSEDNPLRLEDERHLLVFAYPTDNSTARPPNLDEQVRSLIQGVHWPYEPEFATIKNPRELNAESGDVADGRYAAISHYASVLYGHSGAVNASALLIAAQTVGTAARFQLIWRKASKQVEDFQRNKQAQAVRQQSRESLADLADEMGNLELDLTFNVQTAADLGLGSTTAFVDSFQRDLHEVMKFKTRAETVAAMFERVNSSIQSELTAIVSREREAEEKRRLEYERDEQWRRAREEADRARGAAIIGALSFFLAPITVIFGFFGVNTADISEGSHMLDPRFWPVYAFAFLLMLLAVAWALFMWRGGRRPRAVMPARTDDTESVMAATRRKRRKRAAEEPVDRRTTNDRPR
jgi:hypothetical protein